MAFNDLGGHQIDLLNQAFKRLLREAGYDQDTLLPGGVGELFGDISTFHNNTVTTTPTFQGAFASAKLKLSLNNPSNGQTVGINGHTFKYVLTLGAATSFTQIKIQDDYISNGNCLSDAINGFDNNQVVPATTPFSYPAYAQVNSDLQGNYYLQFITNAVGAIQDSVPLTCTVTGNAWDLSDLQYSAGTAANTLQMTMFQVSVRSEMRTAGGYTVVLPFNVGYFSATCRDTNGKPVVHAGDTVTTDFVNSIIFTFGGVNGAAVGDVYTVFVVGF